MGKDEMKIQNATAISFMIFAVSIFSGIILMLLPQILWINIVGAVMVYASVITMIVLNVNQIRKNGKMIERTVNVNEEIVRIELYEVGKTLANAFGTVSVLKPVFFIDREFNAALDDNQRNAIFLNLYKRSSVKCSIVLFATGIAGSFSVLAGLLCDKYSLIENEAVLYFLWGVGMALVMAYGVLNTVLDKKNARRADRFCAEQMGTNRYMLEVLEFQSAELAKAANNPKMPANYKNVNKAEMQRIAKRIEWLKSMG